MKNYIFFLLAMMHHLVAEAQIPQGQPGKPQLPTPKNLRLLGDLTVSCNSPSSTRNTATGITTVSAKVIVKNTGPGQTGAVKIKALVAPNPANKPSTDRPAIRYYGESGPMGSWKFCTTEIDVPALNSGSSHAAVMSFEIPTTDVGNEKYLFMSALVDYYKTTHEANETNNAALPVKMLNR